MTTYYGSEIINPEAYIKHHGILGMHWYQRRFQNKDGTLTPAGKERYRKGGGLERQQKQQNAIENTFTSGAGRLGEGLSRAIKTKMAEKFPWMLRDEELMAYQNRVQLENSYRNSMAQRKQSKARKQFVQDLMKNDVRVLNDAVARKAAEKFVNKIFTSEEEREMQDIRDRATRSKARADAAENDLKSNIATSVTRLRRLNSELRDATRSGDKYRSDAVSREIRDLMNDLDVQRNAQNQYMNKNNSGKNGISDEELLERLRKAGVI